MGTTRYGRLGATRAYISTKRKSQRGQKNSPTSYSLLYQRPSTNKELVHVPPISVALLSYPLPNERPQDVGGCLTARWYVCCGEAEVKMDEFEGMICELVHFVFWGMGGEDLVSLG